ncbi:MAG: hypothetical protein ABR505_12175 [Actinomycetota bacterium]
MRRGLTSLWLLIVFAAGAAPAVGNETNTSVPDRLTYYLVSRGDACGALSIRSRSPSRTTDGCGNPFYGLLAPASRDTARRMTHLAIDGLPFTLDGSSEINGSVTVRSYLVVGIARKDVVGIGQPVLEVTLVGSIDGEDVKIGEFVSDPYTITPAARDYTINFHMEPPWWLSGRIVEGLNLKLRTSGRSVFHGFYPADGSTHVNLGILRN